MANDPDYIDDPALADSPLHLDEVEAIISSGGKSLAREPRKLVHFARRVEATIRHGQHTVRQLNRDIDAMRTERERSGTATTLSPADAVRFLSDDQRARLFGAMMAEQWERVQRELAAAAKARRDAGAALQAARYGVLSVLEDPRISREAKALIVDALAGSGIDVHASSPRSGHPAARPAPAAGHVPGGAWSTPAPAESPAPPPGSPVAPPHPEDPR